MKIIIKTKNLKLDQSLRNFIEEKINSLEKFSKMFYSEKYFNHFFGKGKPKVEAYFEIGKDILHHKKGPFFWAECQMRFPGKSMRATTYSENPRTAITEIKDELQRQLKQYKEQMTSLTKRKTRVFKKSLHLAPQARFWRKGRIREEGI